MAIAGPHEDARARAEKALASGDLALAERLCDEALAHEPAFARALYLKGVVLAQRGNADAAVCSLTEALEVNADYPEAERALGALRHRTGRLEDAARHYRRALALGVKDAETRQELAAVEEKRGALESAIDIRRELQAEQPDLAMNNYNLAVLTGSKPPSRTPAAVTRLMFDDYAGHFEQHLRGRLGYRGPEALFDILSELGLRSELEVLDLGCGTGLCGERLAPHAKRLVGVDLSPLMLLEAQRKGVYHGLACQDLFEFFDLPDQLGQTYDLVVAGDVFIYIGDLAPVFAKVRECLNADGQFAFTVELGASRDFQLVRERRYAHDLDYVRGVAAAAGFEVQLCRELAFRREQDQDVPAAVWVLVAS